MVMRIVLLSEAILDLPSLNISGLEFRIAEWTFHALDGVSLTLEEDGAYL